MGNPQRVTIRRQATALCSPDGSATAPFWVEMLVEAAADGENTAMRASLDPGTITRWHTHPRGQLLSALSGKGLARRAGGVVEERRPGDAVWFAAGEKHWHGAGRDSPSSYLGIQANEAGRFVDWHEPVEALS
ncbi:cupin domain-containing protein [Rhizobium tibeticum]|uniref:cupin domain-containing protein n=1 Tax=Rhizobium tibeticum TaxID=501024 RepID=UPI0027D7B78B|nr:cupin domain-containing protein [Rhizobium tibeticum]